MNYLHVCSIKMRVGYLLGAILAGSAGLAGAAETVASIHAQLQANFTFVAQGNDDKPRLASGFAPFAGDCDDLAFAAYGRLLRAGLRPRIWIVKQDYTPRRHMLTCAGGKCIDTNRRDPVSWLRLRLQYSQWRRARASEAWIERRLSQRSGEGSAHQRHLHPG